MEVGIYAFVNAVAEKMGFNPADLEKRSLTAEAGTQVNATAAYRTTYFSESLNEVGLQVPVPITRQYFDLKTDLTGPVFSKVFTPNNALADRLKHVIEPNFSIQHITNFENLSRVVTTTSSYDYVIPGVTRMSYGLTNRILVRKAPA